MTLGLGCALICGRTAPGGRQKKWQGDPAPCHFQSIAHPGACRKPRVVPHNRRPGPESTEWGREMRVLLSTYDSRGGVEPLVALAVRLQELGAEALVCAPPDCAERLAEGGVPLVCD